MSLQPEENEVGQTQIDGVVTKEAAIIKLPWDAYNKHFRIVKLIDEQMSYSKYYVKCLHCIGPKTLCADTRSTSNLRKHLAVSTYYLYSVKIFNAPLIKIML